MNAPPGNGYDTTSRFRNLVVTSSVTAVTKPSCSGTLDVTETGTDPESLLVEIRTMSGSVCMTPTSSENGSFAATDRKALTWIASGPLMTSVCRNSRCG